MFSHNNSLSSDLRDINLTTFVCNSLPYTDMMTESQENRGQCRKRHYKRNRKVKKSSSQLPGPDNVIESWPNDDIVIEEHDTSSTSETLVVGRSSMKVKILSFLCLAIHREQSIRCAQDLLSPSLHCI